MSSRHHRVQVTAEPYPYRASRSRSRSTTVSQDGIKYFVVTNGDDWEVYETHRPVPMQDKRVTAFKITDMNQSIGDGNALVVARELQKWRPRKMPVPPPSEDADNAARLDNTTVEPVTPSNKGKRL